MSTAYKSQPVIGGVAGARLSNGGIPRPLELVLAGLLVTLLSPLLLATAVLVAMSSPGPILFRQLRVGRHGRVFTLFKFRTMRVSTNGLLITAATDNRITPIGRFLRKWKLDELPELYNVLKGEMSFVGPRPEVPQLVDNSNPAWRIILDVRPGITDPVTLTLRNEEAVLAMAEDKERYYREVVQPYKLRGYVKYLKVKSFGRDVAIIVKTVRVILAPRPTPPPPELAEVTLCD